MVRYEALGSKGYEGTRANLAAALMMRTGADPITRAQSADEVPVQGALALLLREKLTGEPVPAVAQKGVDFLRDWIDEKASADFEALRLCLDDQTAFQKTVISMLEHLELTQAEMPPDTEDAQDDNDGDQEGDEEQEQDDPSDQQGDSDASTEARSDDMRPEGDDDGEQDSDQEYEPDADGDPGDTDEEGILTRPPAPAGCGPRARLRLQGLHACL